MMLARSVLVAVLLLCGSQIATAGQACWAKFGSTHICCLADGSGATGGTWQNYCPGQINGAGGHKCPDTHPVCCAGISDYCVESDRPQPVNCQGSFGTCSSGCQKTYTITRSAANGGTGCPYANGYKAGCAAGVGACPRNCVGSWGTCDANCQKTFTVTTTALNGGTCPAVHGAKTTSGCSPGVGACPAAVNCAGSYGTCDANCEKTYTITTQAANGGASCTIANGAKTTAGCSPGVGACPPVHCEGSYGTCDANCEKTYTITQAPSVGGTPCPATKTTEGCTGGVGACPFPVDCEGSYGECDANCEKTYTITQAANNWGDACPVANGAKTSTGCSPGAGACPANCEGSYGECNANCEKTYTITQAPANGGTPCPATTTSSGCTGGVGACPCPPAECAGAPGCTFPNPVMDANSCQVGCGTMDCPPCDWTDECVPSTGCMYVSPEFEGNCQVDCGEAIPIPCDAGPGCTYANPEIDEMGCLYRCGTKTCDAVVAAREYSVKTELTFPSLTLDILDIGELQIELESLFPDVFAEITNVREGSAIVDVNFWIKDEVVANQVFSELEVIMNSTDFQLLDSSVMISELAPTIKKLLDAAPGVLPSLQLVFALLAARLIFD